MEVWYFFKLFNNIKSQHESDVLAKLELETFFGDLQTIPNVIDLFTSEPFSLFTTNEIRIQDSLTFELPYGKVHGYYCKKDNLEDLSEIVRRLAYTREIYIILKHEILEYKELIAGIFSSSSYSKNIIHFKVKDYILFKIITNQYYLEKSQYISKLSRNEDEIIRNVQTLSENLFKNLYRIPPSSTMAVGKRLVDYFTIREEPSLYLNHYMHPYKGKFHPKMVRALINYVYPENEGLILDNFCGSGTTLVEAGYLGLNSLGVEINPLSSLMCNVKSNSIFIQLVNLEKQIKAFLSALIVELESYKLQLKGQSTLAGFIDKSKVGNISDQAQKIKVESQSKINQISGPLKEDIEKVQQVLIARNLLKVIEDEQIKQFMLLALSGTISDLNRRTRKEFIEAFEDRLIDLYHRIYLYHKLNELLKIPTTTSTTYTTDTRDMKEIADESIDGIVNSPPYSTALDYIKNDEPQLILLDIVDSFEELEKNMMGNPRINFSKQELLDKLSEEIDENPLFVSESARSYVNILKETGRLNDSLRFYKFFIDMFLTLKEMYRVIKKGAKCAIVIGNNVLKAEQKVIKEYSTSADLDKWKKKETEEARDYFEVKHEKVLTELSLHIGFKFDMKIDRELEKTSSGNIRRESIIIFKKN